MTIQAIVQKQVLFLELQKLWLSFTFFRVVSAVLQPVFQCKCSKIIIIYGVKETVCLFYQLCLYFSEVEEDTTAKHCLSVLLYLQTGLNTV